MTSSGKLWSAGAAPGADRRSLWQDCVVMASRGKLRSCREIDALCEDTLIEEFLFGRVSREAILQELGPERLNEIEYERDALRRDVVWGLKGANRDAFLAAVMNPPEPTEKLRKALRRHRQVLG